MPERGSATAAVRQLRQLQAQYGSGCAAAKLALLERLADARLGSAAAVLEYHEALCWLRAYPDDREVLAAALGQLRAFGQRSDATRFRAALAGSGIVGTDIRYPFFADTARWLADRWPGRLEIDWDEFPASGQALLEGRLPLLTQWAESPALDQAPLGLREWIDALRGPGEADGAAVAGLLQALAPAALARDLYQDELDIPMVLRGGADTPNRTHAELPGARAAFQRRPLRRTRPDLRAQLRRPPRTIRAVSERRGRQIIDLARRCMVTRNRDLDVFAYGDPRDVRLVDCGEGLSFAVIGMLPERRLLLESVYGYLTLQAGMPIGYVLVSALFGSSEIAYNVFETYRGGEAAWVYGRVLATTRALFGTDVFTVYPYQLGGDGNEEGLQSGAWWFYQKLGLRARDAGVLQLMERELGRLRRDPQHRSSRATLLRLAAHNVYLEGQRRRDDVIGVLPLERIGMAVTRLLSRRFGSRRVAATAECADEAARLLGVRWRHLPDDERLAFERWSPLVLAMGGLQRWRRAERRDLAAIMRAKGGRRESDYVRLLDAHAKARRSLVRLAARPDAALPG